MRPAVALLLSLFPATACFVVGCATTGATTAARVQLTEFEAPGAGADEYRTRPPAGVALRGPHAFRVGQALDATADAEALTADPRLGELAQWVLEHQRDHASTPPHAAIDLWAHHLGMPEPAPHLVVLAQADASALRHRVEEELRRVLPRHRYTHYGAATDDQDGTVVAVLALAFRWTQLDPVPRRLQPGSPLSIRGMLDDELHDAQLVVSFPDGRSERAPRQQGRSFQVQFPTEQRGEHRIEILAEGKLGTTVVANFPVYVGVRPTTRITVETASDDGERIEADAVRDRLLALINRDRRAAGLSPLKPHEGLSGVALSHSREMQRADFVGHTSPTTGGAADRVEAAGIRTLFVLENIGRGYSPEEVHRGLMDSPGHRANVMSPDATHVGIGVVVSTEDDRPAYLVTQLYGRFAEPIDVGGAPEEVARIVNAERTRRGLQPLSVDEGLSELAQATAERFFAEPDSRQAELLEALSRKAATRGVPYRRIAAMMTTVPALSDVRGLEALLEPDLKGVALGVAQGTRPDTLEHAIAIVVIIGR
ncbi:MAG: CAP domain-containing protein [Myxococcales bacterium]|jgi:uncharacterized protein YkwD